MVATGGSGSGIILRIESSSETGLDRWIATTAIQH